MPLLIGRNVRYSKIDPDMRSVQLKEAVRLLSQAGLVHRVYASSASQILINALYNYKKYKLLFIDLGIIYARASLGAAVLTDPDLTLVHQGALCEQLIGQELIAYSPDYMAGEVAYWQRDKRGSVAEVDYTLQYGSQIVPVEVKSGKLGRLKSRPLFIAEKESRFGIKISEAPLAWSEASRIALYLCI